LRERGLLRHQPQRIRLEGLRSRLRSEQGVRRLGGSDRGQHRSDALMFKKVLIANRGEIALRVIRACKELGLATVAVYSGAARKLAHKLKVPTVPGSPGPVGDVDAGLKVAAKIGFPVIVKAAAGGGGKGMRVAADEDQFTQSFGLAKQEALAAFGSDEVYLEKYLSRRRHVGVQVMGDTHGRVMHLCERDCSVQRRHQKLIEEAPSPALDQTLRQDIGDAAVRLAEAIGYVGAGTIEFLLDEDGSFYFMEMNTRIQVEHPVTEMTTNFDLVKEQIRVAAGEALSLVMNGHRLRGHAIECRVTDEDA